MAFLDTLADRSSSGGFPGALSRLILRLLQFILAITVAGLYGVDLHHARQAHAYTDGKWVFAEVVAGLAAVTCLVYAVVAVTGWGTYRAAPWDWVIFILWTALFGLFGSIYIPAHPTPKQAGQWRMKHAVWVDLVNMLLWLITAVYSSLVFWRHRGGRTLHTGRGKV